MLYEYIDLINEGENMVTLYKIIEGLEMVDDIADCYYNLEKDEIFLSNIGEYEDLSEDEIDQNINFRKEEQK